MENMRITMPTFLPEVPRQHGRIPLEDYFREWKSMREDFKAILPFKDYCQLREDGVSSIQSSDLQRTTGRSPLPMHEGSTSPCESKPKKTRTVKEKDFFSYLFGFRGNSSTVEEVKKIEEKEEEVPCASDSHQEEITSPREEACDNVVTLMEEQPHALTVGAANTFEDGTLVDQGSNIIATIEQPGCTALCNVETLEEESNHHSHEPLLDCTSHWRLGFEALKIDGRHLGVKNIFSLQDDTFSMSSSQLKEKLLLSDPEKMHPLLRRSRRLKKKKRKYHALPILIEKKRSHHLLRRLVKTLSHSWRSSHMHRQLGQPTLLRMGLLQLYKKFQMHIKA